MAGYQNARNAILSPAPKIMAACMLNDGCEKDRGYRVRAAKMTAANPAKDATGATEPAPLERGADEAEKAATPIYMLV
jgi:hypothetical protein